MLQFALGMPSISMSGIPNNAGPPPGTTKNLCYLLYFYVLWLHYILLTALFLFYCMCIIVSPHNLFFIFYMVPP